MDNYNTDYYNIIAVENLTKYYGDFAALSNVNLSLTKGKIVGLLGPNGSGKTTLLKILTGLSKQYNGSILIDSQSISHNSKEIISFLPDQLYFEKWMKITDLVSFFKEMFKDFNINSFNELKNKFQIDDRKFIKHLSKGNKEKLQLALTLSRQAKIYIFDEPIGGIDPAFRDVIIDTIKNYINKDSLVIFSTHQIYDVEDLFDEVIFLKKGNVVLHDTTENVKEKYNTTLLGAFKEEYKNVY